MHAIRGPFIPDPNISTPEVSFEDRMWCIVRKALQDKSVTTEYGVVELADVRAYRCRARATGVPPDVEGELPVNWWALQLEESEFAGHCAASDQQRRSDLLSGHRHFIVLDGNHRAIDIFARSAEARAVETSMVLDVQRLIEEGEWGGPA